MNRDPANTSKIEGDSGELAVPGLRIIWGRRKPFVKPNQHHAETEIAVPGVNSEVVVRYHTASGTDAFVKVRDPQVSIIPALQPHTVNWTRESELIAFFVSPALLEAAAESAARGAGITIAENYAATDPVIRHLGTDLYEELTNGYGREKLYLESIALFLVTRLLSTYATVRTSNDVRGSLLKAKLRRATEFMHDQFHEDISVSDIAAEVHISPFHFTRMFKQSTGRTPYQYLTSVRIDHAKQLLTETNSPIVEIGMAVGYESQSHFTTVFRTIVGVTPGAYRRLRCGPLKTISVCRHVTPRVPLTTALAD